MELDAVYAQLLIHSCQTFQAGHHTAACHLLHAAVHLAFDWKDWDRLADAGQIARNRELWLTRQSSANVVPFRFLVRLVDEMLQGSEPTGHSTGSERRVSPRRKVNCPEPLQLFASDGLFLGVGVADDISAMGIRLLVSTAFAPGEVLVVEASVHDAPLPRFAFEVAWCEALDMGYRIAGPFVPPLPSTDTLALLEG